MGSLECLLPATAHIRVFKSHCKSQAVQQGVLHRASRTSIGPLKSSNLLINRPISQSLIDQSIKSFDQVTCESE